VTTTVQGPTVNATHTQRFISVLFEPGDVVELRALQRERRRDPCHHYFVVGDAAEVMPTVKMEAKRNLDVKSDTPSLVTSGSSKVEAKRNLDVNGGTVPPFTEGPRKVHDLIADYQAEQRCIFVGANPRRPGTTRCASADDVLLARCLFVDVDDEHVDLAGLLHRVERLGLPAPTMVVWSGHGCHLWWRLLEPITDLDIWSRYQRRLISVIGSDPKIHDPPRIMRVPGTINHKGEPLECAIVGGSGLAVPLELFPGVDDYSLDLAGSSVTDGQKGKGRGDGRSSSNSTTDSVTASTGTDSVTSGHADSVTVVSPDSVTRIIESCMPAGPRQRNACLFRLARRLKFLPGMSTDLAVHEPIVREFYTRAVSRCRTSDWAEWWADYQRGLETARVPWSANPFDDAVDALLDASDPFPSCLQGLPMADRIVGAIIRNGCEICRGPFGASCHQLATAVTAVSGHLGEDVRCHPETVRRVRDRLIASGLVRIVKMGDQYYSGRRPGEAKSTRWKWTGPNE
jgi:hypothetical protein